MAEWARLLSECRGNLVAGSNPALPATGTRLSHQACFCYFIQDPIYASKLKLADSKWLFETQLHTEMRAFESQSFIKTVCICT